MYGEEILDTSLKLCYVWGSGMKRSKRQETMKKQCQKWL